MHLQRKGNNEQLAKQFEGLFTSMRDARKLFRLFKSLMEYQKIQVTFSSWANLGPT